MCSQNFHVVNSHVCLRFSQDLDNVVATIRAHLGREAMREERRKLNLKEFRFNWEQAPVLVAFGTVERQEANRVKGELEKVFSKEGRGEEVTLNAVGFALRERAFHEADEPKEDLPDMVFPFFG
jgi:hypothetical protein